MSPSSRKKPISRNAAGHQTRFANGTSDAFRERPQNFHFSPALYGRNLAETNRKKRFRSSSSEESSSPPRLTQENKKSRNENSSSTNHEGEENPLSVFEMSETLDGKLQAILTKLEKLDAIEKSVKILQETLSRMDTRIQALELAQASANRDINDLKESLNSAEDQYKKTTESFKEHKEQICLKLSEQESQLEEKIADLENKNLYLEAYSRRENIKFENIEEEPEPNRRQEDTEAVLRNFLQRRKKRRDSASSPS